MSATPPPRSTGGRAGTPPTPPLRHVDVTPYLSAFLDGELAEPLHAQVDAHVASCEECSRTIARYAALDATLASLPRTAPSPAVFERVAAAVAGHIHEPTIRESLSGRRGLLRRRRLEFAQWADGAAPVTISPAQPSARRGWPAAALPTIAAMLLVALTALTIRGAMTRTITNGTTGTPTPGGTPLEQTQTQVQRAVAGMSMGFTPIYPTYLPSGSAFQGVTAQVATGNPGSGSAVLDVTWTFSGTVKQVHLREGAPTSRWSGYAATPTRDGLTWQAGQYQWTPLTLDSASDRPAVGEDRSNVWLALDATANSGNPMGLSVLAMLRQISLSMDMAYQQDPQQIIPVPSDVVFHYTGQIAPGGTATSYAVDGYDAEAQRAASITLSRGSKDYYTDIIRGQQGIRLDPSRHTYQLHPPTQLTPATLPQSATVDFYSANTLMTQSGMLWNAGPATYSGTQVYDFLLVDAPSPTHVYVGRQSRQVVAIVVDVTSSVHPGGPRATSDFAGPGGCPSYTMIEALPSSQSPSFSTSPPDKYTQGQVPSTLTC